MNTAILNSIELFHADMNTISLCTHRPTEEEDEALFAQARGGDLAARNAVIERCLPYVTFLATTYAKLLSAEYLELVQVGSLAITEKIDKALTMQSPVTYLGMIARYAMRNYAHIHRRAIIVPKNAPTLDVIESLDKPVPDMDNTVLGDLIPEPSQVPLAEEKDYTALYQAIERLSPQRQFVITHHFGLHDTAPESMVEITRAMGARDRNAASNVKHRALMLLRRDLEQYSALTTFQSYGGDAA